MYILNHHLYIVFAHKFIFLQGVTEIEVIACIYFLVPMSHAEAYTAAVVANAGIVDNHPFEVFVVCSPAFGPDKIDYIFCHEYGHGVIGTERSEFL